MTRPRTPGVRHPRFLGARGTRFWLVRLARWHPASFFVAPPQLLSYGPAHGRDGRPNARLLFPQLAVVLEGGIVVRFELLPQGPLLLGGREDASPPSRGEPGREVLALPPHLDPALEGGKGDGEDLHDLLPRDAPLDGVHRPDP